MPSARMIQGLKRTRTLTLAAALGLGLFAIPQVASAEETHGPLVRSQGTAYYEPTGQHPWALRMNNTTATWVVKKEQVQPLLDKLPGDVRARGVLGHTVVTVMANHYEPGGTVSPDTAKRGYRETAVAIPVTVQGADGKRVNAFYVPTLDLDDRSAVVAGKEVYGLNKHLTDISYDHAGSTVSVRSSAEGRTNFELAAKSATGPVGKVAGYVTATGMRAVGMSGPNLHTLSEKNGQLVVANASLDLPPASLRIAKPVAADARQLVDMKILSPKQAMHPTLVVTSPRGTYRMGGAPQPVRR